jgi:hypothetical protein
MRYLLITALPETTDTGLEALRPLVAGYSRAFHAIGGDQPTIEQLLNALDDATSLGTERFSWGGKLLLIDPDGKLMGEFPRTFDPVALSEEFHELTSFRP